MMRALVFAATVVCSTGCGLSFDVTQQIQQQTIQGSPLGGLLSGFFNVPVNITIQSDIAAHSTGPINSITLASLVFHMKTAGATWSFIQTIDIYIQSTKNGTTLPRVKVASASMPGMATDLTLVPVPDVNLVGYINEG